MYLCFICSCLTFLACPSCLPCPALRCPALPCPALPCPALLCPALRCPALPCSALLCPALPCPALPCPALPGCKNLIHAPGVTDKVFRSCSPLLFLSPWSLASCTQTESSPMVHNGKSVQRRELVQAIRRAGTPCHVTGIRDYASRADVEAFVSKIIESTGPIAAKSSARDSLASYLATFPKPKKKEKSTGKTGTTSSSARRVRGKSQLCTYNWDFMGAPLPDGLPPAKSAADLWRMWGTWEAERKVRLSVRRSTSTMEESLLSDCDGRVHIHWKVDLAEPMDHPDVSPFLISWNLARCAQHMGARRITKESARGHLGSRIKQG